MHNAGVGIRKFAPVALAVVTMFTLTACGGPGDDSEQEPELSPQERIEQEAGVSIEPGVASCSFNNELDDYHWDGSGSHPLGELDTAELRETADAYEMTFTGDFFDPSNLTEESVLKPQIGLTNGDQLVGLSTEYYRGELDRSGTVVDAQIDEFDTHTQLEPGKLTATFPKSATDLQDFTPTMWFADVYYSSGDDSLNPINFRCGDGRNWDWKPLE